MINSRFRPDRLTLGFGRRSWSWWLGSTVFLFTVLFYITVMATAAEAVSDVGEDDRLKIQAIIGAQLEAFHARDAERAFSYASPSIRARFQTPARFFWMVRNHYPAVYAARNPEFLQLMEIRGVWIQGVIISDRLGESWLAQYPMEQQPDGKWLINGCLVRALGDKNL
jgi:hypothetical protein